MEINRFSDVSNSKPASSRPADLLARLRAAGTIEAVVVRQIGEQLLLDSRLGSILTSNRLDYRPGDRLLLSLSGDPERPVLQSRRQPAATVTLERGQHPALAQALGKARSALAAVERVAPGSVLLRISNQSVRLDGRLPLAEKHSLLQVRDAGSGRIEIDPVDLKAAYKAILKRLLPDREPGQANSLARALDLLVAPRQSRSSPPAASFPMRPATATQRSPAPPQMEIEVGAGAARRRTDSAQASASGLPGPGSPKPQRQAVPGKPASTYPAAADEPTRGHPERARPSAATEFERPPPAADRRVGTGGDGRPPLDLRNRTATGVRANRAAQEPSRAPQGVEAAAAASRGHSNPARDAVTRAPAATAPSADRQNPARASGPPSPTSQAAAGKPAMPPLASAQRLTPITALLPLVPNLARIDSAALERWFALAGLVRLPAAQGRQDPAPAPLDLLGQLADRETLAKMLTRHLSAPSASASAAEQAADEARIHEFVSQLAREGSRLIEQGLAHNLLQRASLGLQQETQQPLALSIAIPLLDDQQIKPLSIDLAQRSRVDAERNQCWDIRLSFEFGELGPVSCHIVLEGDRVGASFYSLEAHARQSIEQALPRLRQRLAAAGFATGEMHSFTGKSVSDPEPAVRAFGETLIDIEA